MIFSGRAISSLETLEFSLPAGRQVCYFLLVKQKKVRRKDFKGCLLICGIFLNPKDRGVKTAIYM